MRYASLFSVGLILSLAKSAIAQPPPPAPAPPPPPPASSAPTGTFAPPTAAPPTAAPPAPATSATEPAPTAESTPPPVAEPLPPPPPPPPPAPPAEKDLSPVPSAHIPPRSERTLYASMSALLAIHGRAAIYEVETGHKYEQTMGGGGYELVGMLGSAKNGFAFGGAASFVYVAKTDYTWEGDDFPGYHPPIWALSIGPAVDYHPGRRFHIGGLVGLSIEGVPSFDPLPRDRETVPGLAMALWLGFEWAVSSDWNLGVCMTGHLDQAFLRDVEVERHEENSEAAISVGLGVNVSTF